MSPESMIALLSAGAVVLVLGGGYLMGHAKAQSSESKRYQELKSELNQAREQLEAAEKALSEGKSEDTGDARLEEEKALRKSAEAKTEKLRAELAEAKASLAKLEGSSDRIFALEKERDTVLQRADRLERERNEARSELAKVKEEKGNSEADKSVVARTGETVKLITERDEARDRLAAAERLMEGVRARSSSLAAEVKELKAQLEALKKT
jgi:chromosome segregation ATPase